MATSSSPATSGNLSSAAQCESNVTLSSDMIFSSESVYMIVSYSFLFVVALIGNVTMLLILVRNLRVKVRRVYTLLLHMNLADLLVTLIYLPKEIVHKATVVWYGGDIACRLCKFFDTFGVYLSANVLICISLDRFFSIMFPLYSLQAQQRVRRMLIIAWIAAAITSLPQLYIFRVATHPGCKWFTQCVSGDLTRAVPKSFTLAYSVLNLIEAYLLPLIVIIACYSLIVWKISKKEAASDEAQLTKTHTSDSGGGKMILRSSVDHRNNMRRAKHKTLRMTVVMVLAFLICWTPYFVAVTIHFVDSFKAKGQKERVPRLLRKFLYMFALLNSSVNPFLYGVFSFNLRQELILLKSWLRSARLGRSQSVSSGQLASMAVPLSRRTSFTRTPNSSTPQPGRTASEMLSLSSRSSPRPNSTATDRLDAQFSSSHNTNYLGASLPRLAEPDQERLIDASHPSDENQPKLSRLSSDYCVQLNGNSFAIRRT